MIQQNELYHHGVLGMKWGHHKSGLERVRNSSSTKAKLEYAKYNLAKTKADSKSVKLINPTYYLQRYKQNKHEEKFKNYDSLAKAAQKQIDMNDPIGKFFDSSDEVINKGLDWVANNPDKAQRALERLQK